MTQINLWIEYCNLDKEVILKTNYGKNLPLDLQNIIKEHICVQREYSWINSVTAYARFKDDKTRTTLINAIWEYQKSFYPRYAQPVCEFNLNKKMWVMDDLKIVDFYDPETRIITITKFKESTELKNCPCCNNSEIILDYTFFNNIRNKEEYFIMCKKCGIQTTYFKSKQNAITAWNKRPESELEKIKKVCLMKLNIQEKRVGNSMSHREAQNEGNNLAGMKEIIEVLNWNLDKINKVLEGKE